MASRQDPSGSTPRTEPTSDELEPDDSSEEQENRLDLLAEPPRAEPPQQQAEPGPAPGPEPEPPAQPSGDDGEEAAPEAPPAFEGYGSLDEVKLEDFDAAVRPRVESILAHIRTAFEQVEAKRTEFDETRQELLDLIASVQEQGLDGPALADRFKVQDETITAMNEDMSRMAFNAFRRLHPEADGMPEATAQVFAEAVKKNLYAFGDDDNTPLERLEAVYEFARFKTGWNPDKPSDDQPKPPTKPTTPTRPTRSGDPKAGRQALVSGSERVAAPTYRSPEEQSWPEILEEGIHLLR